MRPDDLCPFCSEQEDCSHLFISCPRTKSFSASLSIDLSEMTHVHDIEQLWIANPFLEPNQRVRTTVLTCVLWNVWKCRNAKVFRGEDETNARISRRCYDDLRLNRCFSSSDKNKLIGWSSFFS
ncbi:hypothetical protein SETIT_3G263400v2 [Setaria italica]|uniref:Reverse transcriptase zinc-binding domain-containing protein n=1 Tax=Setaria italica TaxID=4555 RepID=A0A368QJA7_SETIT|nr:hypothetical protein SETIT_3G263400v2 [Setaria italica]